MITFAEVGRIARSRVFGSYLSLSAVTALNVLMPLVTVPYLVHILGKAGYGQVAYYQYLGQFALVVLDFGFPLYAVTEVARRRGDIQKLQNFVRDVYILKILIFGATSVGIACYLGLRPGTAALNASGWLLIGFFAFSALNSFTPTWLFQGLEELSRTIAPTLLGRLITLVAVFTLVRGEHDMMMVPFAYVVGGLVQFTLIGRISARFLSWTTAWTSAELRRIFRESQQVFWSRLAIVGYVTLSPVLIRATAGPEAVAVYSLCEKIIGVARLPFDTLANAAYAKFSINYVERDARRYLKWLAVGGLAAVVVIWFASPFAAQFLLKSGLGKLPDYLSVYAIGLLPISIHGFVGTCVLLTNGRRLDLGKSVLSGLVFYLLGLLVMWNIFSDRTLVAVAAMVMAEIGIMVARLFFSVRHRLI
jgi:polysaccharide transporter, PST family